MANTSKIVVDITALQGNEKSLGQYIARLEALNARLEALLERIGESWEGGASQSYLHMMREYAVQAAGMAEVLREFKNYVAKAHSLFEMKDRAAAARISGSF
ncbi:MAG: hypothetical protein HFI38_04350 [Lachnospiraceae bacterium]|jgi:WXG100 family type VII secretion target|nr:hypothetical protein [Lachnospiraceae bacterium]